LLTPQRGLFAIVKGKTKIVSPVPSFRRKPESRFFNQLKPWTPAFAGVTSMEPSNFVSPSAELGVYLKEISCFPSGRRKIATKNQRHFHTDKI
jgi:hypothetical protein